MVCLRNLLQLPKIRVTKTTTNNPASPHHKTYTYSSVLKVIYTTKYTTTRLLHSQNNQKIPLIILPPAHNTNTYTTSPNMNVRKKISQILVVCAGIYFMVSGSDVKLSFEMTTTSPNTIGTTIPPQPFHHKHSTTTLQLLQPLQPTFLTLPRETLQLLFFSWINQDSLS